MSGSVFRADALREAGGYSDLSYGEDANLALLLPAVRRYHRRRIESALDGSYGRRVLGDEE